MLKFLKNLLLIVAVTTSLLSAQALRFPTNVRFIAGGYINKSPYFNTLNGALNDVKAFATSSNPYTFYIDGDTTFISDWDSVYNQGVRMRDSINIYYVNYGKIKWGNAIPGFDAPILAPDLQTLHFDLPKWNPVVAPVWQDSLSQALDTIDAQLWNLIVYCGPYLYIRNDTLQIDTTGLGYGMSLTEAKTTMDTASFVGTDTVATITVSGSTLADFYVLQPIYYSTSTTVNANDVLYWIPVTGGFIARRKPGGTAYLRFSYIRRQP